MRLRLQNVLGRKLYDSTGACAGRIEEVVATWPSKGTCEVKGYLLGREGWAWRLSIPGLALTFLRGLGGHSSTPSEHLIPWDKVDWSDPRRPRLTCTIAELKRDAA